MNSVAQPPQAPSPFDVEKTGLLGTVPAWGSYLFNNYLLPSFSPSDWINSTPTAAPGQSAPTQPQSDVAQAPTQQQLTDYFENWSSIPGFGKQPPTPRPFNYQQPQPQPPRQPQSQSQQPSQPQPQAGPSVPGPQWN